MYDYRKTKQNPSTISVWISNKHNVRKNTKIIVSTTYYYEKIGHNSKILACVFAFSRPKATKYNLHSYNY